MNENSNVLCPMHMDLFYNGRVTRCNGTYMANAQHGRGDIVGGMRSVMIRSDWR